MDEPKTVTEEELDRLVALVDEGWGVSGETQRRILAEVRRPRAKLNANYGVLVQAATVASILIMKLRHAGRDDEDPCGRGKWRSRSRGRTGAQPAQTLMLAGTRLNPRC